MADGGTGEKTEEPTPERLRKLRKEGNVAKSQDVTAGGKFLGVFVCLALLMPFISEQSIEIFHLAILAMRDDGGGATTQLLYEGMWTMMLCVVPVLGIELVLAIGLTV